jgi:tryptophanyl-tRNA synthetase
VVLARNTRNFGTLSLPLLSSDTIHSLFASMRVFASCHVKAMKAWLRGALIQRRGLSSLPTGGKNEAATLRLSRKKSQEPREPVVFSGIQPTGIPHLGNYLGALRPWVELQNDRIERHRCLFSVVDLHALTIPQNAELLAQWRKESFASLLAVGLNPERSVVFIQSDVSLPSIRLQQC